MNPIEILYENLNVVTTNMTRTIETLTYTNSADQNSIIGAKLQYYEVMHKNIALALASVNK